MGARFAGVRILVSVAEADAAMGDLEGDVLLFPAGIRLRGVTAANAGAVIRCVRSEFAVKGLAGCMESEREPEPGKEARDGRNLAATEGMSSQQHQRHSIDQRCCVHSVAQKRLLGQLQESVPSARAFALPHASLAASPKAGNCGGVFAHIFVCADKLSGSRHETHGLALVKRFRDLACSEGLRSGDGSHDSNGGGGEQCGGIRDMKAGSVSVRPCAHIDNAYRFDGRAVIFTTVAATAGLLQLPGLAEEKSFPFVGDWYGFMRSAVVDEIFAKHIVGGLTLGVVWRGRCGLESQMMKHAASELLSLNPCTTSLRRLATG